MPNSINRFTVTGQAVHQNWGKTPFSFSLAGCVHLSEEQEQPYLRQSSCGNAWEVLKFGWIDRPYVVVLRNTGDQMMYYSNLAAHDVEQSKWALPPGMSVPIYIPRDENDPIEYKLAVCADGKNDYSLLAIKG